MQGAMRGAAYDVQLFELLGTVLLRMGDLAEAGKFLFLSGVRRPEYLEAIQIFLSRHGRKKPHDFLYTLPRSARLKNTSNYPHEVAQAFKEMGCPEVLKDRNRGFYPPETRTGIVPWLACVTIAVITVGVLILGAIKVYELISSIRQPH